MAFDKAFIFWIFFGPGRQNCLLKVGAPLSGKNVARMPPNAAPANPIGTLLAH